MFQGKGIVLTDNAFRNVGRDRPGKVEYNGENPDRPPLQRLRQRLVTGDDGLRRIVWDLVPLQGKERELHRTGNYRSSEFFRMVPLGDTKNASCLWGMEPKPGYRVDVLILPDSAGRMMVWYRLLEDATGRIVLEQTWEDDPSPVRTTVAEDDVRECCHGIPGHCDQFAPRAEKVYVRPPAAPKKRPVRFRNNGAVLVNGKPWEPGQ